MNLIFLGLIDFLFIYNQDKIRYSINLSIIKFIMCINVLSVEWINDEEGVITILT